eukprot:gnl/MRDRNA2_/MRDRNA2_142533_c0_seq1.p1 gnl/MRDRNA2_/MRDRNA2_142533_c0~~gnl/MRDRNA2_/MRDRNA2_142533_c0_seq1.p1  ORF type:complete len:195 (+),score=28.19 gnl/MRDRNA2_/MRDRNA2_142533_c0_seq1:76-660(+)
MLTQLLRCTSVIRRCFRLQSETSTAQKINLGVHPNSQWRANCLRRGHSGSQIFTRSTASVPRDGAVRIVVNLPDDAVLALYAEEDQTLLEALHAGDLSDIWEGGFCGGCCGCSTCRVVVHDDWWSKLEQRSDPELDMLESANDQASAKGEGLEGMDRSRLSCQIDLCAALDGLEITLPEDVINVMEVPLWLRRR